MVTEQEREDVKKLLLEALALTPTWHFVPTPTGIRILCARGDCPMGAIIRAKTPIEALIAVFSRDIRSLDDHISPIPTHCAHLLDIPERVARLIASAADGDPTWVDNWRDTEETRQLMEDVLLPHEPHIAHKEEVCI